jgi:hypothetical protein
MDFSIIYCLISISQRASDKLKSQDKRFKPKNIVNLNILVRITVKCLKCNGRYRNVLDYPEYCVTACTYLKL